MSNFSGKSDFCDWCTMHNRPKDIVEKATIFMGNAKVSINKEHDLIPYYTNLISMMSSTPESQTIYLTQDSYIDTEEAEFLSTKIYTLIKLKRKANKEKATFDYAYVTAHWSLWTNDEKLVWLNLISIINVNPSIAKFHLNADYKKALFDIEQYLIPKYFYNVHDAMHTRYREQFIKFCSENGYQTFSWNAIDETKGEWHPLIRKMCFAVIDYRKMEKMENDK